MVKTPTPTKMFRKANITWAHYEHNKCGILAINMTSPPHT